MTMPPNSRSFGAEQWEGLDKSPERSLVLSIPARPELWGLARMTVASVASQLGFDFEQVEDLRLAVDELSIACARGTLPDSVLRLSCHWSEAGLYLECVVAPVASVPRDEEHDLPPGLSQKDLSESILAALVDAYGISIGNGSCTGWLRKAG